MRTPLLTLPRAGLRAGLGGSRSVWLFSLVLAAGSAALWLGVLQHLDWMSQGRVHLPWWALALVFCATEAFVVHIHFRSQAHSLSLNEVGLVIGLYYVAPGALLTAQLAGCTLALVLWRRQTPVKLAFNLAQTALTTGIALLIYERVSMLAVHSGPTTWAAVVVATTVASLGGVALVALAMVIARAELSARQLQTTALLSAVATLATSCLAIVGAELLRTDPRVFALLAVPGAIIFVGFRSYVDQRRRHEHLEFLYESMQRTQGAPEFGLAIGQLLIAVRRLVRAEYAEIFLLPTNSELELGLRSSLSGIGEHLMRPSEITSADQHMLALAGDESGAFVFPRARPAHPLDDYLRSRGLRDGMVTVLRSDSGPLGLLVVGDRSSDVDTFKPEDAALLETFGVHASVLIENGRLERSLADVTELKEELHHQAYHDTLTGLPNRALFVERVEAAMQGVQEAGDPAAVLFLDLDGFKTVNDSKGHQVGDELLVVVGRRVQACMRAHDLAARLGGDEFAILLCPATPEHAESVARRLLEALAEPIVLAGSETFIHASVGVAPASSAADADELLRNADVAMYAAKSAGRNRVSLYESEMHAAVRQRNTLALDLEHAVERGEIEVVYQPIVSLRTGRVVSVEALARWNHGERGLVQPLDFIPVAEETGLMPAIGRHVLREACRNARVWRDAHPAFHDIGISVNLSPSELSNDLLPGEVAQILLETRIEASSLTLEITESATMGGTDEVRERMHRLRDLGIRLALDDFGTGHSSLERLDTLPLDILKIARPFVEKLMSTGSGPSFIDAFVRLANSLDLECVAEGIEEEIQVPRLLDRGCAFGQGYHFAKPMGGAETLQFLETMRLGSVDA